MYSTYWKNIKTNGFRCVCVPTYLLLYSCSVYIIMGGANYGVCAWRNIIQVTWLPPGSLHFFGCVPVSQKDIYTCRAHHFILYLFSLNLFFYMSISVQLRLCFCFSLEKYSCLIIFYWLHSIMFVLNIK
jgi:hypothetical protein